MKERDLQRLEIACSPRLGEEPFVELFWQIVTICEFKVSTESQFSQRGLTLMELARFVLPANIVSIESTKGVDQNAGDCFDVQTYRLVCIVHEGAVIEVRIA